MDQESFEMYVKQALEHQFPGKWDDFLPTMDATAESDGVGLYIPYHSDAFTVATGVIMGLKPSVELIEEWGEINKQIPMGALALTGDRDSLFALWIIRLRRSWFDGGSRGTHQMILDVLTNAPTLTRMCAQRLQARCGGEPVPVSSGWPALVMGHM
jgi:hypothetical protein